MAEYDRERRTMVSNEAEAVYEETEEVSDLVFLMDRFGYCRTVAQQVYDRNRDSVGTETRFAVPCRSDERICLFTDTGNMHVVRASEVPSLKLKDKGCPIDNLCQYDSRKEHPVAAIAMERLAGERLLHVTGKGMFKTKGNIFLRFRADSVPEKKKNALGVRGIRLAGGDAVEKVFFPDRPDGKVYKTENGEVHLDRLRIAGHDTAGTKQKI